MTYLQQGTLLVMTSSSNFFEVAYDRLGLGTKWFARVTDAMVCDACHLQNVAVLYVSRALVTEVRRVGLLYPRWL